MKQTIEEQKGKISALEKSLAEYNKEMEAGEREKKKNNNDLGTKDAKLNRAIEEMEKYKLQLKEAKA